MKQLTGILLIAISAASFGTLAMFGRFLYAEGVDTFTMLFLRFGCAALLMLVILLARREKFPRGKILLQLIGMGALGYVGQSFSYLTAIKFASAGLVVDDRDDARGARAEGVLGRGVGGASGGQDADVPRRVV